MKGTLKGQTIERQTPKRKLLKDILQNKKLHPIRKNLNNENRNKWLTHRTNNIKEKHISRI